MGDIMNIRHLHEATAIEEWATMRAMYDDSFDTRTDNSLPEGVHHIIEDDSLPTYEEMVAETHEACVRAEIVRRLEKGLSERPEENSVIGLAALPYVQTNTGGLTARRNQRVLSTNVLVPKVNEPVYKSGTDLLDEMSFITSSAYVHNKDINPKSNLHHHSTNARFHMRQRKIAKQTAKFSSS